MGRPVLELLAMRELGWINARGSGFACANDTEYWKRGGPGHARIYFDGRWHAIYVPKGQGLGHLELFDCPIAAAVWLNVELAGE